MSRLLDETVQTITELGLRVHDVTVRSGGQTADSRTLVQAPRVNVWSVSKTFTAIAVGFAVDEGLFALDDRLADFFPEYGASDCEITVSDAISMKTGHGECPIMKRERAGEPVGDILRIFFDEPMEWRHGTHWHYDNSGWYAVSRAIEKTSGEDILTYLTGRVFAPLGIETPEWERCPNGHPQGFSGLHLNSEEIALAGEKLMHGEIAPRGFIEKMTSVQTDNSLNTQAFATDDHRSGYGYGLWMNRVPGTYRMDGNMGNYCVMLPEKDAVVCFTSEEPRRMTRVLDLVWDTLYDRL